MTDRPNFRVDIATINPLLLARIESLAHELLPNGRREGHEWRVGSLAGEAGQSLGLHLTGARAGWWKDFAGGAGGDPLALIAAVLFRGEIKPAIAWAVSWLGLDNADPARLAQHRLEASAAAEKRDAAAEEQTRRYRASAQARWLEAEALPGTPAEKYLQARGIDLRMLGRAPGALRFHAKLLCAQAGGPLPAMVAMAIRLDGTHVATHRTWIEELADPETGELAWGKARVDRPKMALGGFAGAHIPLWKGASRATLREIPEGTHVYVSEGIEDGLTAAAASPEIRAVAAISLGNIAALELPPQMGELRILGQRDPPGSKAEAALQRAIAVHRGAGRRVRLVMPPAGCKDLNELAMRGAA